MANAPIIQKTPNWLWAILGVLTIIFLAGAMSSIVVGPEKKYEEVSITSASAQPTPKPETQVKAEKFLIFSALGILFLAASLISKIPFKGFIGGIGALLLISGLVVWAILWTWPELLKEGMSPPPRATAGRETGLPAGAALVKKLAPGERQYFTRQNMTAGAPKFYFKNPANGQVVPMARQWPNSDKSWGAENWRGYPLELYIVLPSGQSFIMSATDPALSWAPP